MSIAGIANISTSMLSLMQSVYAIDLDLFGLGWVGVINNCDNSEDNSVTDNSVDNSNNSQDNDVTISDRYNPTYSNN